MAPPVKSVSSLKGGASTSPPARVPTGFAGKGKAPFGPLSREQYVSRLVHSGSALEVAVPLGHGVSYTLQYAYVSQRGLYPDSPHKENQDAFVALPSFGGVPSDHLFGVFDGHGEKGTQCAQFAADKARARARERSAQRARARSAQRTGGGGRRERVWP
jgi:hypothetical protein